MKIKKFWSLITGINLIIALIGLNIIVSFLPNVQLDLTSGKLHSLSDVSKDIVRNLDDIISIKVFITGDLPPEIKPIAANLVLIIKEFERINPVKLKINYIDPSKNDEAKNEAVKYGIQPLQFSSVKSDKFEVQTGYFGLVMIYEDKQEVLPVAGDVGNLEYFVVSGINKLTVENVNKVTIAEEQKSNGASEYQYLRKYLEKSYTILDTTLESNLDINKDSNVLVILGRTSKIDDKAIEKIREWIKSGKGLVVLLDRVSVGQNMQALKNQLTGLEQLLAENGIKIDDKLVLDESSAIANFRTQTGAFLTKYPYWLEIRAENIKADLPFLSGINSLTLPWASPLELSGNAKSLFSSSEQSVTSDNFNDLSPLAKVDLSGEKKKQVIGAVNTDGIKLIVIGDADLIKDQLVTNNQQNLMFVLNAIDYFGQDSRLFTIRSKTLQNSPLIPVTDNNKNIVKAVNILSPLLILMIVYFVSGWIRNKRTKRWYALDTK